MSMNHCDICGNPRAEEKLEKLLIDEQTHLVCPSCNLNLSIWQTLNNIYDLLAKKEEATDDQNS